MINKKKAKKRREQYSLRKSEGKCPRCGEQKDSEGFIYCSECRKYLTEMQSVYDNDPEKRTKKKVYYRERYQRLKKLGICVRCGKEKAKEGFYLCESCNTKEKHKDMRRRRKAA